MTKTYKAEVSKEFKSQRNSYNHWLSAKEELEEAGVKVGKKVPKPSSGKYKAPSERWLPPEKELTYLVVPTNWISPSREEVWLLESLIKEKWPNEALKPQVNRWKNIWKVKATIQSLTSIF